MKTSHRITGIAAAVAASLALAAQGAHAAVDYFLKIDGIPGESTDDKHKGEIEIESWSWGVTQTGSGATGAASRSATRPCVQSINFTKHIDKSSPRLMADAVTGMTIPTATLVGRKAGENPVEFLKVELKTVLVSSYSMGGSSSDIPLDQFSLNFANMSVEYKAQKPDGTAADTVQSTFQGGC